MKKFKAVVIAATLSMALVFPSYAGEWIFDGPEDYKYWYKHDDGGYTVNDWEEIDGKWYHFDENGYLDIGWHQIPKVHEDGYTYDEWYYFDKSGAMLSSGKWEGGYISSDGSLICEEVDLDEDGVLKYYGRDGYYKGTIGWKNDLYKQWQSSLGDIFEYGTYSTTYQLPADWSDYVPLPLMSYLVDYACFWNWGGYENYNWQYSWNVDANNVIHIEATYYEE